MIELIKDKLLDFVDILLGRKAEDQEVTTDGATSTNDNSKVKTRQVKLLIVVLIACVGVLLFIINIVQERKKIVATELVDSTIKVEVAADSVDVSKLWPNKIEEEQRKMRVQFEEKLRLLEDSSLEREKLLREEHQAELNKLTKQLEFAAADLNKASIEFERVSQDKTQDDAATKERRTTTNISNTSFATEVVFDKPKSINDYIPEGSYISGYTMTGLAVSTGLNAPTENATPIILRITDGGNLPTSFRANMSKCKILGSSYGDLSSERAKIRLEKLVCTDEEKGLITTTDIAGTVYGPDGMDGIKGKITATSSRHIRNALTGGIIGGLASSAKGQDSGSITSAGIINTKKKGFGQLAGEGVMTGTSNAADKVADYYLRQAEAMSPVLTVPAGVKVDAVFTKGVYFGELGTRRKIKDLRTENENKEAVRSEQEIRNQQQTKRINQDDLS